MGEEESVWSEVLTDLSLKLGIPAETLAWYFGAAVSVFFFFLFAWTRRCGRCGCWFTMHEASIQRLGVASEGHDSVLVTWRCSVCAGERHVRTRMRRAGW